VWRRLRIGALLAVLVFVAAGAWVDRRRTTDWDGTLWIGVFPVVGDDRPATQRYVGTLNDSQFDSIAAFFEREAHHHGLSLARPVRVQRYPPLRELPPRLEPGASVASRIAWSLRMRAYAWQHAGDTLADIRVFVLYHDPDYTPKVPHSLGLQKGLLGVVHAFADGGMDGQNAIVIAHEVMHTLGATDKYNPANGLPSYPDGYAEPRAEPRHPQQAAEIMAGRIALSDDEARMPDSLEDVVVGDTTATEINWRSGR